MVIGEGQKFVSALIIPSISHFKDYFSNHNLPMPDVKKLSEHNEVKKIILDHIKLVNKSLAPFEQIKRPQLIDVNWTVESGEITPKLSLRRKVILEQNKLIIDKIFGQDF
jgi:long-chain acyl-CoA synthetase